MTRGGKSNDFSLRDKSETNSRKIVVWFMNYAEDGRLSDLADRELKSLCMAVDSDSMEQDMNQLRHFKEITKFDEVHLTVADESKALATRKGIVLVMVRD